MSPENKPYTEALDVLSFDPHHGLRFLIDQIVSFHAGCESLGLPTDNPFSFFFAMDQQLNPERCKENAWGNPIQYRPLFIGLLLLYAVYGDRLFCSAYRLGASFPDVIGILGSLPQHELKAAIHTAGIAPELRNMLSEPMRKRIFSLYPELLNLEEQNEMFEHLKIAVLDETEAASVVMPESFAEDMFSIFLDFFKVQEGIVSESKPKGKLPAVREQRQRLSDLLCLRRLALEFAAAAPDETNPEELRCFTEKLRVLLNERPNLPEMLEPLHRFQEQMHAEHLAITERMGSEKAQIAGLIAMLDNHAVFSPAIQRKLYYRLKAILDSWQTDALCSALETMYHTLSCTPALQAVAPAYVWRIFTRYRTPLYSAKSGLIRGSKAVDFSASALLDDWRPALRSEERTSAAQAERDLALFDALCRYFAEHPFPIRMDRRLNEYLLQRMLFTQMNLTSHTGVLNQTLRVPKPLFRGFALIADALSAMGQGLWKQMPHLGPWEVTMDEADAFFKQSDARGRTSPVMSFLLERSGNPPIARKENLTAEQCRKIVQLALCEGFDPVHRTTPAERLDRYLTDYLSRNAVLRDFTERSRSNRDLVLLAVYRLAIERTGHLLTRQLLQECAELFYRPIPQSMVRQMWQYFFAEREDTVLAFKESSDQISIGSMPLFSRLLLRHRIEAQPPRPEQLRLGGGIVVQGNVEACTDPDQIAALKQSGLPLLYALQTCCKEEAVETARKICNAGYHGLVLPPQPVLEATAYRRSLPSEQQNETAEMLDLAAWNISYRMLIQALRQAFPTELVVAAQLELASTTDAELRNARVLCRWHGDDGADAVIVRFCSEIPAGKLHGALNSIATSQPVPTVVALPEQKRADIDGILTKTGCHAILLEG